MTTTDGVAIVTGSGSGIGRATAKELAKDGRSVVVADIDQEGANQTVELIEAETDQDGLAVECDVSDQESVQTLFDTTLAEFGRVDVLVNNAGIFSQFDTLNDSFEKFENLIRTNLYGAYFCTRRFLKERVDVDGYGRIVNVSAMHSQYSHPNMMNYDIAKAGMEAMTRSTAVQHAEHVIANAVGPGFISTPMLSGTFGENPLEQDWFQDLYVENKKIPMARPGEAEEVAKLVCFLASERNTYVTGQMIPIDGGLTVTY